MLWAFMVVVILSPLGALRAQMTTDPHAALEGAMQTAKEKPSTDSTPVSFTIGDVPYQVPRNYLIQMERWSGGPQALVGFKVALPGFDPLTVANNSCMTVALLYRPPGCTPIEFRVIGGGGSAASDEAAFDNMRSLFLSPTPSKGPYGYDVYETGPADARIETYVRRVSDHLLIFQCFLHKNDKTDERAVCGSHSRLADDNELEYYLYLDQLPYAEQVDRGIRNLISSFVVNKEARR
jgi:hypothetical protein